MDNAPHQPQITAPVSPETFDLLEQAASLSGQSVNEFVIDRATQAAAKLVESEQVIRVSENDAKVVFTPLRTRRSPTTQCTATCNVPKN